MAIRALNQFSPAWFTPASEKKETSPTRFLLRGLDGVEQSQVAPEVSTGGKNMDISPRGTGLLLRHGLAGWENFSDDAGPIAFDPDAPYINQARMPYALQIELAVEIFTKTFVSPETKKK